MHNEVQRLPSMSEIVSGLKVFVIFNIKKILEKSYSSDRFDTIKSQYLLIFEYIEAKFDFGDEYSWK